MFTQLQNINRKPEPFSVYTTKSLWTNPHIAERMLKHHLEKDNDSSSYHHSLIDRSVNWMIGHFDLKEGSRILDLGCGPGLYAKRLAQKDCRVTGVDFSGNSIAYARRAAEAEGLDIDYREADYLAFSTDKKFDLIIMISCDFCVLNPEQRNTLLKNMAAHLAENGAVLFDVHSENYCEEREEESSYARNWMNGFFSPEEYFGFYNLFKYPERKLLLDQHIIVKPAGEDRYCNWIQCYSEESLTGLLKGNGLKKTGIFDSIDGKAYTGREGVFTVTAGLAP